MRVFCDTSVLVEIDRSNEEVVKLLRKLVKEGQELLISTVTVAEIFTGSYLRKDASVAILTAKEVLNQFVWQEIDGAVAEIAAKLYAYLILEKKEKSVEYADVLIAASFFGSKSDVLLTLNKKNFVVFPQLREAVSTPKEFRNR